MAERKLAFYYAWNRPGETEAPLPVIENRFLALFESRRLLYPRFEEFADRRASIKVSRSFWIISSTWARSWNVKGLNNRLSAQYEAISNQEQQRSYIPNANKARPAATRTTCLPSIVNEIGGDLVVPPSERRQTSRPLSASKANNTPPEDPNTNPPAVDSNPLCPLTGSVSSGALYCHFWAPVAASSAITL